IIDGNEAHAKDLENDPGALFWEAVTRDEEGQVTAFKQFKKSLAHEDKNFTQLCLCNPCGLYLYKMEKMRPENIPCPAGPIVHGVFEAKDHKRKAPGWRCALAEVCCDKAVDL
ncbi:hypothetical protein KEM55_006406, partial [Ascosphaera atra]